MSDEDAGTQSPETGEGNVLFYASLTSVAAFVGAVVARKNLKKAK